MFAGHGDWGQSGLTEGCHTPTNLQPKMTASVDFTTEQGFFGNRD